MGLSHEINVLDRPVDGIAVDCVTCGCRLFETGDSFTPFESMLVAVAKHLKLPVSTSGTPAHSLSYYAYSAHVHQVNCACGWLARGNSLTEVEEKGAKHLTKWSPKFTRTTAIPLRGARVYRAQCIDCKAQVGMYLESQLVDWERTHAKLCK